MEEYKLQISQILSSIRPEFDFDAAENFFESGMLDSFDLVLLVSALDKHYGISIKGIDIIPENFGNIAAISSLLSKYGHEPNI